ncbi:MAG: hypothetical protein LBK71_07700 [Verrucomicrobiales bacterium]|nr:hypothetical protein [Verrucomicrobiales bacterium]
MIFSAHSADNRGFFGKIHGGDSQDEHTVSVPPDTVLLQFTDCRISVTIGRTVEYRKQPRQYQSWSLSPYQLSR